jgi:hypothetical protein
VFEKGFEARKACGDDPRVTLNPALHCEFLVYDSQKGYSHSPYG